MGISGAIRRAKKDPTAVIQRCQLKGPEGNRMMRSLRDWWATGANALDQDGAESISPIRRGITLLEAERSGRAMEPGAAEAPQPTVIEQLDAATSLT